MYTIKDVAEKMDVSEHTLRFWSKSGFFPFVKRDKNNIRIFFHHGFPGTAIHFMNALFSHSLMIRRRRI